jgi:hypothetical protein
MRTEQLLSYSYEGGGNVKVEPTDFLLSLKKHEQKEALLESIAIYEKEKRETKDLVQRARFDLFIEFSQHLLTTQDQWARSIDD